MKNKIIILITVAFHSFTCFAESPEEYFQIAAENNPGLLSKYKEYEAALQKLPQVGSLPDPQFSFGYFISPVETRVGPQRAKFSLTQMFPWFGTLKARENSAALYAEAKFQAFIEARNLLYYKIAGAYYPLYELNQLKLLELDNIEILKSYRNVTTKQFENNTGAMVDILRVDLMLNEAYTNLEILNDKEKPLLSTFNKLLNRDESVPVSMSNSLEIQSISDNFRKDSLLENNPVLNELNLKIEASKSNEEIAFRQGLPNIGIGVDYVMVGKRDVTDLPDNGKDILMPMLTISLPVFREKYRAAEKEAQIMQESYTLQMQDYSNNLISEYETTMYELKNKEKLLSLYSEQIETTNKTLKLLLSGYANSGNGFEEVLRMQQQLIKYRKLEATARVEYSIAMAKLNYLTSKVY